MPPGLARALAAVVVARRYPGLFFLLLVEEAGVPLPLPGHGVIMYAGSRARDGQVQPLPTIALITAAATLGSCALYWLARRGGRPALLRYGRLLRLRPERLDAAETRLRRWGPWAIILGRLVPGLRTPTSAMAGLFAVPARVFVPCTALAALLWAAFYFTLGYYGALLAPGWRAALVFATGDLDRAAGLLLLLAAAVLAAAVLRGRVRRRARRHHGAADRDDRRTAEGRA